MTWCHAIQNAWACKRLLASITDLAPFVQIPPVDADIVERRSIDVRCCDIVGLGLLGPQRLWPQQPAAIFPVASRHRCQIWRPSDAVSEGHLHESLAFVGIFGRYCRSCPHSVRTARRSAARRKAMRLPADTATMQPHSAPDRGKARLLSLEHLDGRTAAARRARDVVTAIESDLGGGAHLTEAERQIVRRAAILAVVCESNEAAWLQGGDIDLGTHNTMANTLRRLFEAVGLQRRTKNVTPTPDQHLTRLEAAHDA